MQFQSDKPKSLDYGSFTFEPGSDRNLSDANSKAVYQIGRSGG
jgi:hypothetical protein